MEFNSGSITPPASPSYDASSRSCKVFEPTDVSVAPVFTCESTVHPRNATCYIPLGAPYIWLLGRPFFRRTFSRRHLSELFWMARLRMLELSTESKCQGGVLGSSAIARQRQELSAFFSYLRHEVERLLDGRGMGASIDVASQDDCDTLSGDEFCTTVFEEVKQTLLCVGHICDNLQPLTGAGSSPSGVALFHLCLEAWWTALQLADMVSSPGILRGKGDDLCFCDVNAFGQGGAFSQVTVVLLWDLCCLSSNTYQAHNCPTSENHKKMFACDCVRRLWIGVVDAVSRRHEHYGEEPFWTYFNFVLEGFSSSRSGTEPKGDVGKFDLSSFASAVDANVCNPGFCLWILMGVASIDSGGSWTKKGKSNYGMAKKLVQSALAEQGEAQIRSIVGCCTTLHGLWEPSLELLLPLLEFFLKNLNESFQASSGSSGVQGSLVVSRSAQQLCQQAKLRTEAYEKRASENSFELFLTLLATSVRRYSSDGATTLWKQLRGRIYIRFHGKKMLELTETGLQNCLLLFLVLALSADLEESMKKLFSLFDMLPTTSSPGRLSVVMKGMFASLLVLQSKAVDLSDWAKQTADWFFAHCLEKPGKSSDCAFLQQKAALLPIFLEGLADLFDGNADLAHAEHKLLAPELKQLLEQSSPSELAAILGTLQEITERIRTQYRRGIVQGVMLPQQDLELKSKYSKLSGAVYSSVLPYVYRAVVGPVTSTPPLPCVTDAAVAIALLTLDLPSTLSVPLKVNFGSLFEYFGCSDQVHPRVSSRFLCLVLEESGASTEIVKQVSNLEAVLVQAWLRCCVGIAPPCEQTSKLSRLVSKLKEPSDLVLGAMQQPDDKATHDSHAMCFFASVAEANDILLDIGDAAGTARLKQKLQSYLQDFAVTVRTTLKGTTVGSPILRNMYSLCGHLFKHCAVLLYTKGMPGCLLPQLLDWLVLPGAVYAKKAIPQQQMMALKQCLPLFLEGLLSLQVRNDPYLLRKLKDVVIHYLPLFSTTQSVIYNTGQHPLLVVVDGSGELRGPRRREMYVSILLECICESFISKKGSAHVHFSQALRFAQEVVKRVKPVQKEFGSVIELLLPVLLENLLTASSDTKLCHELVTQILQDCKDRIGNDEHRSLVGVITSLVRRRLAWSTTSVFRLLRELATLHPRLVAECMAEVTIAAKEVEEKRGAGSDQAMRNNLAGLLRHIDECREATSKT